MGAGLGGLIALVVSDLAHEAPRGVNAIVATAIVTGGAALAYARVNFEHALRKLDVAIATDEIAPHANVRDENHWPERAEVVWYLAIVATIVAGIMYLVAVWWTVADPGSPATRAPTVVGATNVTPVPQRGTTTIPVQFACSATCTASAALRVPVVVAQRLGLRGSQIRSAVAKPSPGQATRVEIHLRESLKRELCAASARDIEIDFEAVAAQRRASTSVPVPLRCAAR